MSMEAISLTEHSSGSGGLPLSGVRVVECASFIAGPYCGKLLADLGADVVKVEEQQSGDRSRYVGPFPGDKPDPEKSGLFLYLNTNKKGVAINLRHSRGAEIMSRLLALADVLVEDLPSSSIDALGLSRDRLKRLNPRLVLTSITPFGRTGPCKDYVGSDIVTCQMSGLAYCTPTRVDDPGKEPPLRPGGRQTEYVAGATGAVGTMLALLARQTHGRGEHVDVSHQEAILSFMRLEVPCYTYDPNGFFRQRIASRKRAGWGPAGYLPCKDGFISMSCREEYQWRGLMEEAAGPDWLADPRLSEVFPDPEKFDATAIATHWEKVRPVVVDWTMRHTKQEIYTLARNKKLPLAPCNDVGDLVKSAQLAYRSYFAEVEHSRAGRLLQPGAPFKLRGMPHTSVRPAPLLGQHNREVIVGELGYTEEQLEEFGNDGVIEK